ncbi:16255_t:CDS:10 [Entrophospora sp. SA101]|nr:16255_t:CDS:10 [Entrophospora sp. SA101]
MEKTISNDLEKNFYVINSFGLPSWEFTKSGQIIKDNHKKSLLNKETGKLQRNRRELIYKRFKNNDMVIHGKEFKIFGRLGLSNFGEYVLEDVTESSTNIDGFFPLNSFVIVKGKSINSKTFKVSAIENPPVETIHDIRKKWGNFDFLGLKNLSRNEANLNLDENSHFVIISDLWLDKEKKLRLGKYTFKTFVNLRRIFESYNKEQDDGNGKNSKIPLAFIFIGDFFSEPLNYKDQYKKQVEYGFRDLTRLILKYPMIKQCGFIFVPGPNDNFGNKPLPYFPIFEEFTKSVSEKLPNAIFTTNPCRCDLIEKIKSTSIQNVSYNKHVIFDLKSKSQNNNSTLSTNNNTNNIDDIVQEDAKKIIRMLLCQSHLCPVPDYKQQIHVDFDHALWLYPVPDVLITADRYYNYMFDINFESRHEKLKRNQKNTTMKCSCLNPGTFNENNFKYMVYWPVLRKTEMR